MGGRPRTPQAFPHAAAGSTETLPRFASIRVISGLNFGCGGAALGDPRLFTAEDGIRNQSLVFPTANRRTDLF